MNLLSRQAIQQHVSFPANDALRLPVDNSASEEELGEEFWRVADYCGFVPSHTATCDQGLVLEERGWIYFSTFGPSLVCLLPNSHCAIDPQPKEATSCA